jgi:hypothetical protein
VIFADGKWISGKNPRYQVQITYRFGDPSLDERITKSVTLTRNDLRYQSLPTPGTPVAIAYLDQKHYEIL